MIGALCTIFLSKSFLEAEHLIQTIVGSNPLRSNSRARFSKGLREKMELRRPSALRVSRR
jgi:hypothetical protein